MSHQRFLALLRGINVGGHHKVPMAELRELCGALGWEGVQTYIQSGNVVFDAEGPATDLELALQEAIRKRFEFSIDVLVRDHVAWSSYVASNPFPGASETEPKFVHLALSKSPPRAEAVAELRERAAVDERVEAVGGALWIHYASGVGRSKLSPALLDRCAGSTVTARNWRTVLKLDEMLAKD